jgi:prepilin-type processing-associated H-X9-DG protein
MSWNAATSIQYPWASNYMYGLPMGENRTTPGKRLKKLSNCKKPSEMGMFIDGKSATQAWHFCYEIPWSLDQVFEWFDLRHAMGKGVNTLYVDGHVKTEKIKNMTLTEIMIKYKADYPVYSKCNGWRQ